MPAPAADTPEKRFAVGDCVAFRAHGGKQVRGHLAAKGRTRATVVTADGRQYQVPYSNLAPVPGAEPRLVQTREDGHKATFAAGDEVSFRHQGQLLRGRIVRMNASRASVLTDDEQSFKVPYSLMQAGEDVRARAEKLQWVAEQARQLIAEHGLKRWSFQFDDAPGRGGCCRYDVQVISLSRGYVHGASDTDLTDTILHEIAHALVGPKHHHDATWAATARRIGCTARRCHQVRFTPSRYLCYCARCDWSKRAQVRRKLLCPRCRVLLHYRPAPADDPADSPAPRQMQL